MVETNNLITQRLAAISENSFFSPGLTAVFDAFKLEREMVLSAVHKLKAKLSSQQKDVSTTKLARLLRTYDANVGVLENKILIIEEKQLRCMSELICCGIVGKGNRDYVEGEC